MSMAVHVNAIATQGARLGRFMWLLLLALVPLLGSAATLQEETAARVNQIRAIRAGQSGSTIDTYNKQMDEAWKFFASNRPKVLPLLRGHLKRELAESQPNDMVLLDIGYFVHIHDGAEGKALAFDALFRLNPLAPVVVENIKGLFEFAHAAARLRDPRVVELIDKAFLPFDRRVFIPQHALTLNGTLLCVFLYGAYGPEAELALMEKLKDKGLAKRALEILIWLGSPESLPQVAEALKASPDFETIARVTSYMMEAAGPQGRSFMLELQAGSFDERSRQYLASIQGPVRNMSYEPIRASFARLPGDKALPDVQVKERLAAMIKNFGKDERTSPLAVLDSGLSADFLIAELVKVRSRTLHRLSDEALSEVKVTNALINGLRYRPK